MNTVNSACDPAKLQQAISESLDPQSEQQLAEHLSGCESCRNLLDQFAGEAAFWSRATERLAETSNVETTSGDEFHSSVFVRVDQNSPDPATLEVGPSDETQDHPQLPFDPPTHPEMLGRIDGFSIEQIIGRGGMGVVYKGFDSVLNRPVAIKFLAPHLSISGVSCKRFSREAQAAAAVVHPNVVPIYSIGSSRKRPYLVMALVSGRSLQTHVHEHGPLPVEDVVRIGQQIAAGLSAAHQQGLVHRDIKPANILLEKDVSRVLITDFGLARAADETGLTQSGWLAGTPQYMSPEQARGHEVDHRSDLFSLGSVMYFMATGREPFRADHPYAVLQQIGTDDPVSARSLNSRIPAALNDLIFRLLSKAPKDRFESANAVQQGLTKYLAYLQNPTQHHRPKFQQRRSFFSSKRLLGFVFAGLVAVLLCFVLPALFPSRKTRAVTTHSQKEDLNTHSSKVAIVDAKAPGTTESIPPPESMTKPMFNFPPATSTEWAEGLRASEVWRSELSRIDESLKPMEQQSLNTESSVEITDPMEAEKAELRELLEALEQRHWLKTEPSN